MSIPGQYKGRYFYHFTHIKNLESICTNGLLSTNKKMELGIKHVDVANPNIQERRHNMNVTCSPHGTVHDYVPFYWCTINPMMLALVNAKNIDQQEVVFLAVSIEKLLNENVIFTSASANTAIHPEFYNNVNDLVNLDWGAIDRTKWGCDNDEQRHNRMAEVLVYEQVPFSDIDCIITWNPSYQRIVKEGLKKMDIDVNVANYSFNNRYFYFTQYPRDKTRSLVTGPYWLKRTFDETIEKIIKKRSEEKDGKKYKYSSIKDLLEAIEVDFSAIPELGGIFELETVNDVHSEDVSTHTKKVVDKLINSKCFEEFDEENQDILKLSAYLHDIGKGPKLKWKDSNPSGKQPAYPDHPVDSLTMLERILVDDIKELSNNKIRLICLLVGYHDLIGEIIGKGRDIQQLFDIINNEKELKLLVCLNRADVTAINIIWSCNYNSEVGNIVSKAIEKLNTND